MSLPSCCDVCYDYTPDWNGETCVHMDECPKYANYIKTRIDSEMNDLSDNYMEEE